MRFLYTRFRFTMALLALSLPAFAGGFFVEIHTPNSKAKAASSDAFLVARLIGCHQPERGGISATAVGVVDGKRQSRAVKVLPLGSPGAFVVERNWPADGNWVLHLDGTHPDIREATTTLVKANGESYTRDTEKLELRFTTKAQIDAGIRSLLE